MDTPRRSSSAGLSDFPRLIRSHSVAPSIGDPSPARETLPFSPNSGGASIRRSKSTSKSHLTTTTIKGEENCNSKLPDSSRRPDPTKPPQTRENHAGIFHRHRIADVAKAAEVAKLRKERSVASSPSAWALSPGRLPAPAPAPAPPADPSAKKKGGSVAGVLRYFRQRRPPAAREESLHELRMLQTRLLQWRFVNARAEAAMAAAKSTAEKKLFNVWLAISRHRSSVKEMQIEVQKMKAEIQVCDIVFAHHHLLNEWEGMDKRNLEAVTKTAAMLQAACLNVPLVDGAKANTYPVYKALCTAMDVMDGIEETISRYILQVEKMGFLLQELALVVKEERESLERLMQIAALTSSLEVQERSLRVRMIQGITGTATFYHMSLSSAKC